MRRRQTVSTPLLALALLASGCAGTSWSSRSINVELTDPQLPSTYADAVAAGEVPLGAHFQRAFLLRADEGTRSSALVVSSGFAVRHTGEIVLDDARDVRVAFRDGRAWISPGDRIPYVDAEGRVFLLDREQVFGVPSSGGDLRQDRILLDEVLADTAGFSPQD